MTADCSEQYANNCICTLLIILARVVNQFSCSSWLHPCMYTQGTVTCEAVLSVAVLTTVYNVFSTYIPYTM